MSTAGNKVAYIMDRQTQGTEMRKLQERMAAGEFQDDELAAMLETHANIISTGKVAVDVDAPNNLGVSSVSKSKSVKDDLDISMELNRQLKAMEERMAATSPIDEFHPMNRPSGSAKSAKSAKLKAIKGGKGKALKAVAAGAAAGVVAGAAGRGSASPASGYSPAPGRRSSSSSSRTPSGLSVSQPRFRPERKNRTYTAEEQIKMRRDNVSLLSNLERIQRRGGGTDNRVKKKGNHVAAASINRFKGQRTIANENMAFLKRLQSVKSSGSTGIKGSGYGRPSPSKSMGGRKTAGGAPPRRGGTLAHRGGGGGNGVGGGGGPKKLKGKPEWVDLPVGAMPRV